MTRVFLRRYIIVSHVLLLCCIVHVTVKSTGYYDSIVDFLSNKTCTAVLYNYGFMVFALACKVPVWLFLGRLSQMETEQLMESGRNYLMDAVLFLVLSKPRYNGKEIMITELVKYLAFLVALKCFHILLHIRLSHMFEVEVPGYFKLLRICTFIYTLSMINTFLLTRFFADLDTHNTFSIWIIFEIFGMLHSCIFCALKYVIHIVDFYYENGLANKTTVLFYVEFFQDFLSLISFGVFTVVFFVNNPSNIPAYMLIDMLHIAKNLAGRIRMLVQYRLIAKALNQRYPKPTQEEIDSGAACIICRDVLNEESRRIDCGHSYHLSCLKSWLFQHSTCPTCRAPIEPDVDAGQMHFAVDPSQWLINLENRSRSLYRRVRNSIIRSIRRAKPRRLFCRDLAQDMTEPSVIRAANFVIGCFAGTPIKCKIGIEADKSESKFLGHPKIKTQEQSQQVSVATRGSLERVETFDLEADDRGNGNENGSSEFPEVNADGTVDVLESTLYRNFFDADGGSLLGDLDSHVTLDADGVAASFTALLAAVNLEDDLGLWLPCWVVESDNFALDRIRELISSCQKSSRCSTEGSANDADAHANDDTALLEQLEEAEYRNHEAPSTDGADNGKGDGMDFVNNDECVQPHRMDEHDSKPGLLISCTASTPISTLDFTATSASRIPANEIRRRTGALVVSEKETLNVSTPSSSPVSQTSGLCEADSKDQRDFERKRDRFTKFLRKVQEKIEQKTLRRVRDSFLDSEATDATGEEVITGSNDDTNEAAMGTGVRVTQAVSTQKCGAESTDDTCKDDEVETGSNLDAESAGGEKKSQFNGSNTSDANPNASYNHILSMLLSRKLLGLEQLLPIKALQLPQHDLLRDATNGGNNDKYTHVLTRVLQSYLRMMNTCNLALRCFAEVSDDSKIVERLLEFNNRQRGAFRIGRAKVLLSGVHQNHLHSHNDPILVSQDSLRMYNDVFKRFCGSYKKALGTMDSNRGLQMTLNLTQRLLLNMSTADAIVKFEFSG